MTHIVNTAQSEAWNGYEGEHWADHADRYDAVNSGINEPLLAAAKIGPGDRILDIGCGNGQLTRAAARRAASATGVDLSGPMLARARLLAEAEGVRNVSFEQGDAQVFGFAPGSYEVAISRFGIMFFADPVAAFTNVARALGPGGRLAVAVPAMADSEISGVFAAAAAHLPGFEAGHGFSVFADPAATAELLGAAGFAGVGNELVVTDSVWGADVDEATEFVVGWGPVRYHRLRNDFGTDGEVRAAVAAALAPYAGDGPVRLRAASRLVTATVALP
jgi:SAM-dependent methyltransferase